MTSETNGDPFADCADRVKQSQDFILKRCIETCEKYPWWDFPDVLDRAKQLARNADRLFKADLGNWDTFLGFHLRALTSIAERKDPEEDITRAHWERRLINVGSDLYGFDGAISQINAQPYWHEYNRRRRKMRVPKFLGGGGTTVVLDDEHGLTALHFPRLNHGELRGVIDLVGALRERGFVPNEVRRVERQTHYPASRRARRICKTWGLDPRRLALMDPILADAAVEIEDSLTDESEVAIFHWLMSDTDGRNQSQLANDLAVTKGALSKAVRRVSERFREWCNQNKKI